MRKNVDLVVWILTEILLMIILNMNTPGPHLMRIHLVRYSTSGSMKNTQLFT